MTPKDWAERILAGDLSEWDNSSPAEVARMVLAMDAALRPFAALDPANSEDVTSHMVRKARAAVGNGLKSARLEESKD